MDKYPQVLTSLVRAAPLPLSDQLMLSLFPAAARLTLTTDDNTVLQAGGECLRAFISVAPDQVGTNYGELISKEGLKNSGGTSIWFLRWRASLTVRASPA